VDDQPVLIDVVHSTERPALSTAAAAVPNIPTPSVEEIDADEDFRNFD